MEIELEGSLDVERSTGMVSSVPCTSGDVSLRSFRRKAEVQSARLSHDARKRPAR
ncbi:MAG TPA: hypothetical protein VD789_00420 [Thermomicrobiales bacterium]|nr:hypothetical protein [Thermomicrobiales bacterium]